MNEKNIRTELIRKSNQIVEASYRFSSISEARIIHLLLTKINTYDKDFKTYEISVAEFARFFEIRDANLHTKIKQHLSNLARKIISIEKQDGGWLVMGWLSSAEYIKGRGIVELCFDAKLKPYLLDLKNRYTQFNISEIVNFTGIYAIRFFEFIKENQFKADKNGLFQITFEYVKLRKLFEIVDKEYKLFSNFRKDVIEPAVTEINTKTNFSVKVSYGKTGRAITHITFDCTNKAKLNKNNKNKQELKLIEVGKEHPNDVMQLIECGISEETACNWHKKYGSEKILRNIAYAKAKQDAGKIKDDVTGYIASAIANDYAQVFKKAQETKNAAVNLVQEKEKEEARKESEIKDARDALISRFQALPQKKQEEIKNAFESELKGIPLEMWMRVSAKNPETPEADGRIIVSFTNFLKQSVFN